MPERDFTLYLTDILDSGNAITVSVMREMIKETTKWYWQGETISEGDSI